MTEIYRIENKKGESCYSAKWTNAIGKLIGENWCQIALNRPFTQYDKGIERKIWHKEICGFKTPRQALKWFNANEIRRMRRLGFDLVKVKVQQITEIGECQVLAIR